MMLNSLPALRVSHIVWLTSALVHVCREHTCLRLVLKAGGPGARDPPSNMAG